ncbi:MAG: preprotein translocase subunit YajC, partial [Acidobacteriota bacterium]
MVLIFVLFYFMIILPQRKRQKAIDQMLDNLKM